MIKFAKATFRYGQSLVLKCIISQSMFIILPNPVNDNFAVFSGSKECFAGDFTLCSLSREDFLNSNRSRSSLQPASFPRFYKRVFPCKKHIVTNVNKLHIIYYVSRVLVGSLFI